MNNNIKVSIITPTYNSEKTIYDTIESVMNQTYKNIEYIIVDGYSDDRTMDIVKGYQYKFPDKIKYISEKDTGIYNAMNKGIRMSSGSLIGIINSDDYYEQDAIEKVVANMTNDKYQMLYGYCKILDRHDKVRFVIRNSHENLSHEMLPHPTCFVTRKTYCEYGLFMEFFKVVADYELMLRFYRKDVKFIQIQDVLANFREGGFSTNHDYTMEVKIIKNMHKIINFKNHLSKEVIK